MKKILIIDDERGFTEMVKLNLEATGLFTVQIENIPTRALDTVLECQPDLILLDIIMPELEGPDIVYLIRNNERVSHIPIVFLTATITREEVVERSGTVGGHVFLAKPCSINELIEVIEQQTAKKS